MPDEPDRQSIVDEEHLRLLSLGYMISAGFAALFCILGLFYVLMGIVMGYALAHAPVSVKTGAPPPAFVGWIFAGVGMVIFLLALGVAIARYWAARCIKQRKCRTYCMVIATIGCLEFPYGTALGVLSLMVLSRPSVARQFIGSPGN